MLLADADGDSLRALGPRSHDDPIRLVDSTELLRTLERLLARTSLEAKRELSEELARLDRASVAGVQVRGLATEHLHTERLRADAARWGLLASGGRFRLYDAAPTGGSATGRFLELDVPALTGDDRPLAGLLSPEYLADGGFDRLLAEARDFGVRLRRRIDTAIRHEVLPVLGRELGLWAGDEAADDERRGELEAAALTFVFQALFLLYAESAGHLPLPTRRTARTR